MRYLLIWLLIDAGSMRVDHPPQQQIVQAASVYWEGEELVRSLSIAWCESYHTTTAYNGADHGAWQINEHYWAHVFNHRAWSRRYTAEASATMAHHIWKAGGWKWWTCGRK
mgnify:FL=1